MVIHQRQPYHIVAYVHHVLHHTLKTVYRPLPDSLTIMPSKIEGLGLFAIKEIPADKCLGMTHYYMPGMQHDQIRTPLGGFINHSDNPNCALYKVGDKSYLVAEKNIEPLEELTIKYSMYKIEGDNNEYERRDTTVT